MNWNGEKLNALLVEQNIPKSRLAEQLGVSRPTIYKWIAGREPRGSLLLQLCELLAVDPSRLYDGKSMGKSDSVVSSGKLFKKSGVKLIYLLLADPRLDQNWGNDLLNVSVRELASEAGMSTGSVSELLSEMKERGFLLTDGRSKQLANRKVLFDHWMHGYMEYRFKVKKQCFEAKTTEWWCKRNPEQEEFLWGGEPAASILTDGFLRPETITIYTTKPLYDLVVDADLYQVPRGGNVEFIKPFPRAGFVREEKSSLQTCVHPLLVYADLICSSDDRNRETATRIYDRYLRQIIESA